MLAIAIIGTLTYSEAFGFTTLNSTKVQTSIMDYVQLLYFTILNNDTMLK